MTPQRAKELLPVIQAFAEGKKVEFISKISNSWTEDFSPSWLDDYEYRVKPEPREWWIIDVASNAEVYATKPYGESIHVREVLE